MRQTIAGKKSSCSNRAGETTRAEDWELEDGVVAEWGERTCCVSPATCGAACIAEGGITLSGRWVEELRLNRTRGLGLDCLSCCGMTRAVLRTCTFPTFGACGGAVAVPVAAGVEAALSPPGVGVPSPPGGGGAEEAEMMPSPPGGGGAAAVEPVAVAAGVGAGVATGMVPSPPGGGGIIPVTTITGPDAAPFAATDTGVDMGDAEDAEAEDAEAEDAEAEDAEAEDVEAEDAEAARTTVSVARSIFCNAR